MRKLKLIIVDFLWIVAIAAIVSGLVWYVCYRLWPTP